MIDLGPPPLDFPTPAIVRPIAGGPWGSLDRELARLGLASNIRRAVVAELHRVAGSPDARRTIDDLSAWSGVNLAQLPGLAPLAMNSRGPATITFLGAWASGNVNSGGFGFTGTFGTPADDRCIVVAATGADGSYTGGPIYAVSIGGISADVVVTNGLAGIAIALVPSETSGSFGIYFSPSIASGCTVAWWAVTGLSHLSPIGTHPGGGTFSIASKLGGAVFAGAGGWTTPSLSGVTTNYAGGGPYACLAAGSKVAEGGTTTALSANGNIGNVAASFR